MARYGLLRTWVNSNRDLTIKNDKNWLDMARNRMIPTTRAKGAWFWLLTESRLSNTPTAQLGPGVVSHNEYSKG